MRFGVLLKRFVEPFGLSLNSLLAAAPSSIVVAATVAVVDGFGILVTVSPALGTIDAVSLLRGQGFVGGGLILEPRLDLGPV